MELAEQVVFALKITNKAIFTMRKCGVSTTELAGLFRENSELPTSDVELLVTHVPGVGGKFSPFYH